MKNMKSIHMNGKLLDSLIFKGLEMMGWSRWDVSIDEMLCAASYYVASIIEAVPAGCPTERMWERHERRIDALRAELRRREEAKREDADMYAF